MTNGNRKPTKRRSQSAEEIREYIKSYGINMRKEYPKFKFDCQYCDEDYKEYGKIIFEDKEYEFIMENKEHECIMNKYGTDITNIINKYICSKIIE